MGLAVALIDSVVLRIDAGRLAPSLEKQRQIPAQKQSNLLLWTGQVWLVWRG